MNYTREQLGEEARERIEETIEYCLKEHVNLFQPGTKVWPAAKVEMMTSADWTKEWPTLMVGAAFLDDQNNHSLIVKDVALEDWYDLSDTTLRTEWNEWLVSCYAEATDWLDE